ncbi:MAG: RraA family protein [Burkholderiales bacterium]|nr:RraA family protein [Burkholderiales bacterium]
MADAPAPASLAERLARCYTGVVYDVLRGRGITECILPSTIVPLDRAMVAAGPVFTVRGLPDATVPAHETLLRWTELLSRSPRGHVVMVQGNDAERALMGELSAETLQFRGVRGYIVDGGCRDTGFIRKIGFPVFCDKATPRDIVGAWVPVAYDEPISYGQVVVRPGDYVLADCDGIVVIPGEIAEGVVSDALAAMSTEDKVRAAILSGVDPQQAYLDHGKF